LGTLVFVPGMTNSFLSDDWPVIARNKDTLPLHAGQLFKSVRHGWYRPVFDLFIALCWKLFGLDASLYHLTIALLYAVTAALVGSFAEVLVGSRGVGVLSCVLFATHGVHAEPALWIASSNEVLAGLFALLSITSYAAFRRSRRPLLWLTGAWLCYLLAIGCKETAVFLPLLVVGYDVWIGASATEATGWSKFAPTVPFLLAGLAFTAFRIRTGSPYPVSVGVARILINVVYYLAVECLALPDNYGYLTSLSLWRQSPFLPLLTVGLGTGSLGILLWGYRRFGPGRSLSEYDRARKFALGWSICALLPVVLTATGRTAFMSSIGVAWFIAVLSFVAWRSARDDQKARRAVVAALALFIIANLLVSSYRASCWRQAGHTMENVLSQLDHQLRGTSDDSEICLVGLPDHIEHAYTFRNAFPALARLLYPDRNMRAILDVDSTGQERTVQELGRMDVCGNGLVLWYDGTALERVR